MLNGSLKKIDKALIGIIKIITIVMFSVLSLLYFSRIAFRILSIRLSFHWADEIIEFCFAGIVFLGSAALWMTKGHFSAGNFIIKLIKKPIIVGIYRIILELISLAFILMFLRYSWQKTLVVTQATMVLDIPVKVFYAVMPVSALIMCLYSFRFLIFEIIYLFKPELRELSENEDME